MCASCCGRPCREPAAGRSMPAPTSSSPSSSALAPPSRRRWLSSGSSARGRGRMVSRSGSGSESTAVAPRSPTSGTSGWRCIPPHASARRPTAGRSSPPRRREPRSARRRPPESASGASVDIACPASPNRRCCCRCRRRDCVRPSHLRGASGGAARADRPTPSDLAVPRRVSSSFPSRRPEGFSRHGARVVSRGDKDLPLAAGRRLPRGGAIHPRHRRRRGPSGCGKTTVLKLLAGFEAPSSGDILMDGRRVSGASRDRGVVFQGDDSLYGWLTAVENVEFGLRMRGMARAERRRRAMRYLDLVGLTGQERKYPAELSGGMKQRIQIARALVNEPTMLLMDEPFAALDAQTRSLMQLELANLWRTTRTTVFFITHDIDEAITLGSRIGVMRAGPRSDVKGVIDVALDGARSRTDDAFIKYYKQVYEMIRDEVAKSIARAG